MAFSACSTAASSSVVVRLERCGSSVVWIDWKSCSGARVISSALKAKPASAALEDVASTITTGPLSSACSAAMTTSTAPANFAPPRTDRPPSWRLSVAGGAAAARAPGRRIASGTTISETTGAAAMPSATNDWPWAIPIAASSANRQREQDSISTSPP